MAANNGGYTTGANREDSELHKRNVTSYEKTNGSQVVKVEAEDTKKLQKVSRTIRHCLDMETNQNDSRSSSRGSLKY